MLGDAAFLRVRRGYSCIPSAGRFVPAMGSDRAEKAVSAMCGKPLFSGNGLVSRAEQDSAARHTGKKGDLEQRFGWDCL